MCQMSRNEAFALPKLSCLNIVFMKIRNLNKIVLITLASAICIGITLYAVVLSSRLKEEEDKNMNRWAMATSLLAQNKNFDNDVFDLILQTVKDNTTIPVIVADSAGVIHEYRNLSADGETLTDSRMKEIFEEMKSSGYKIDIPLGDGKMQYLYYSESHLLEQLSYTPAVELGVIVLFVLFAYLVFAKESRADQNKVWIGLARESAHQLGTPITALVGWKELLETTDIDPREVAKGIGDDIQRLSNIAERFSKIGSNADFDSTDIVTTVYRTFDYLRTRVPRGVSLSIENRLEGRDISTPHNTVLIGWVVENLCRNAIDAMEGKGELSIRILEESGHLSIEVCDTGKGMTRGTIRQIFKAGYTTKKRGWGIGLSLTKRIVEQYHKGKIAVKWSEVGKGTIMRVMLGKIGK